MSEEQRTAAQEREQIVAWLRRLSQQRAELGKSSSESTLPTMLAQSFAAGVLQHVADRIEAGAHIEGKR